MESEKLRNDSKKKERALKISYKNRKQSLLKKGYELATLCGIDLCIIIYDPEQGNKHVKLETWPEDPKQVKNIITKYQRKQQEKRPFLHVPETDQVKYPVWNDRLNDYSEDELAQLLGELESKLKVADEKLKMMKGTSQIEDRVELELFPGSENVLGGNFQGYEQRNNGNVNSLATDQVNYTHVTPFNPYLLGNWQQTVSNGTNEYGVQPSNNTQLNGPICLYPVPWNWENSMFSNATSTNPCLSYIDPSIESILPFSQFPVMFGVAPQMNICQSNEAIDYFQQKEQ